MGFDQQNMVVLMGFTIWLFHIAMDRSTKFLIGKPSVSIGPSIPWLC